jgi:hypothetical protein
LAPQIVCHNAFRLNGPTPKALLLLLCARIGYTPQVDAQH